MVYKQKNVNLRNMLIWENILSKETYSTAKNYKDGRERKKKLTRSDSKPNATMHKGISKQNRKLNSTVDILQPFSFFAESLFGIKLYFVTYSPPARYKGKHLCVTRIRTCDRISPHSIGYYPFLFSYIQISRFSRFFRINQHTTLYKNVYTY